MTPLDQLRAAADAGLKPRFADLPEDDRIQLTDTLVPQGRPFTAEERALFSSYVLQLDAADLAAVQAFNASIHPHKAPLVEQADGSLCVPADLLTWCGQGDGYHAIQAQLWRGGIIPNNPKPQASLYE